MEPEQIDLAKAPDFDLGELRVSPSRLTVIMNGEERTLEPKVTKVLVALAYARPEVVSRDRLIEQCWDGRVVGDDALNRCILALRHLAKDYAPEPFMIKTVPRVGYSLAENPATDARTERRRNTQLAAAALLVLLLIAGLIAWQQLRPTEEAPAAIAVLPFRNVGSGDAYFAEGIGEEILSQLAREPHFRVAGSSSSSQFGQSPDVGEVARRLDVDYVLEGTVRKQGGQVRVDAGLVRTSDEMRIWSDSYDGKLDDIFAIQREIGAAIAAALKRKLVQAPALSGPLVTKGEAYDLYLTARALIRTNNRRVGSTAVNLLRDAIRIDPGYAPAWASLADATQLEGALVDHETFIAATRKARVYAERAVVLAPNLAEAHRSLGLWLPYGDPQGMAHIRRAAALEPNDAETLLALGSVLSATGDFAGEIAAYQKANELDPFWFRTTGQRAIAMASRGDRAGAESLGKSRIPDKEANLQVLLGRIAWIYGDYSEAARQWAIVGRSNSPRWGNTARRTLYDATYAVGVRSGKLIDVPEPPGVRSDWRAWMEAPPSPTDWKARNRDPVAAGVYRKKNLVAAKLMLNDGRWLELLATYDSPTGLFGLSAGKRPRFDQLNEVAVVALVLRAAGRAVEADRLLRLADSAVRATNRKGTAPFWFDVVSAEILAVEGRREEALTSLERAFQRGWRQNSGTSLREITEEPAFRSLHGEKRFQRLSARLAAHYARERVELGSVDLRVS